VVVKLLAHHAALPKRAMIGARLVNEDGTDQRGCRRSLLTPTTALVEALHLGKLFPQHRLNYNFDAVPKKIVPVPAISGAFMFLARDDFWRIGGFDENYFLHVEDLDLCFQFRKQGGEIYFVPEIIVTHVGSTSAATKPFIEMHKARGFSRYFHKNFEDKAPRLLLWLLDIAIWARMRVALLRLKFG
jgi:GT2 family glycosyltransferase